MRIMGKALVAFGGANIDQYNACARNRKRLSVDNVTRQSASGAATGENRQPLYYVHSSRTVLRRTLVSAARDRVYTAGTVKAGQ